MARQALPPPTNDRKARQYFKIQQIGKGTFGTVHLVRDNNTGNTLVMKEVSLRGTRGPVPVADGWKPPQTCSLLFRLPNVARSASQGAARE